MALNKTEKNWKTLIGKRFTTTDRVDYQELSEKTINIYKDDIWINIIDSNPATTISNGFAVLYDKQVLTPDPIYPDNVFFFMINSGSFVAGVNGYDTGITENAQQRDFINERFGALYEVKLYSNDNIQIGKTNPIEWLFDYVTGVLYIDNPGSYQLPYKLTAYQYTGNTLANEINDGLNITDRNLSALETVYSMDLACGTPISEFPLLNSGVRVYINGERVPCGDLITDYCYFSNDSGSTAKAFGSEESGDYLYWMGSVANYELEIDDLITFDYIIN